ncbi:uncharacterized protein SPPG_01400 [Spizellomyces punctatus DAOM BR117]|uniref:Dystroglycan-type cadherin-like domain-containing protein n=1 Tax=Spizellomyces punctatus (strain DAOM BR117) TaxID=645134 RepID=A0A0L0HSU3_SPIPD|nr:uncharacterized protein SPPG_01400 [Spizellomyces punctatus DAOM BR117]KND03949.1 hypothetical protein SPPG_01400 [Spizellomyces punctatus DAOM BR117]|eukprot:XP_016611988.1 hypothetical protein SPPG_01400 [Spizellomyces punctatus DAOM BR117]
MANVAPTLASADASVIMPLATATGFTASLTVTDPDSNIQEATVSVSGGYTAGDQLFFTGTLPVGMTAGNSNGLAADSTNADGVLKFAGSLTPADYQTILQTITLKSSSKDCAPRTVTITATDVPGAVSAATTTTFDISGAPSICYVAGNTLIGDNNAAGVTPISGATLYDDTALKSVSIAITEVDAGDLLSVDLTGIADLTVGTGYDSTTRTLTITPVAPATTVAYSTFQSALRGLKFSSTGALGTRTLTVTATDANDLVQTSSTFTVQKVAAPVIAAQDTSAIANADAAPVSFASQVAISDADSTQLSSLTIRVSNNASAQDTLDVDLGSAVPMLTKTWNSVERKLTVSGPGTMADYQTVLRTLTFSTTNLGPGQRTIEIQAFDSDLIGSTPVSSYITLNVPPTIAPLTAQSIRAHFGSEPILPNITLGDSDGTQLKTAVVSIDAGYFAGDAVIAADSLSITGSPNITASAFNSSTLSMTLSGSANISDYQNVLQTLQLSSSKSGARTIGIKVIDMDGGVSDVAQYTANVYEIPRISMDSRLLINEGTTDAKLAQYLSLADPDSGQLKSVTAELTGYIPDVINGTIAEGSAITSVIEGSKVTFSGLAPLSEYQSLLRTLVLGSAQRGSGSRILSIKAKDDTDMESLMATTNIKINSAPTIALPNSYLAYEHGQSFIPLLSGVQLADVDNTVISEAVIRISPLRHNATTDSLSYAGGCASGLSGWFDKAAGTLTFQSVGPVDNYANVGASLSGLQDCLRTVNFATTSLSEYTHELELSVSDGAATSQITTVKVVPFSKSVTSVPDAGTNSTQVPTSIVIPVTQSSTQHRIAPQVSIPPSMTSMQMAKAYITEGYIRGEDTLVLNNTAPAINQTATLRKRAVEDITAAFDPVEGSLTLTGSAAPADFQSALRNVHYASLVETPSTTNKVFGFVVSDGANLVALPVTKLKINRAPTVVHTPQDYSYYPNTPFTFQVDSNRTFADLDGDALTISASSLPTWVTFDATTNMFAGVTPATIGNTDIAVEASDGFASVGTSFKLQVEPAPASSNKSGKIAGGVIGSVAGLAVVGLGMWMYRKKRSHLSAV